jgi:hypothetical protein
MGVGAPGGPRPRGIRHGGNKAKAAAYRHSEKGMMTRKMRLMDPQVKAHNALRRAVKRQMKAGF